jgi:hypothetical protein
VGEGIYARKITYAPPPDAPLQKKHRDSDDRPIDTSVKDNDNELMAIAKQVIKREEITHNEFKNLFESSSDFNNFLRQIERCDNLSFNRFTELLKRLGLEYSLDVYKLVENGEKELVGGR